MKTGDKRDTYTCDEQKNTDTLFDSSKGNVPVAAVCCVIVEFGAPDGPPQPRALCFHISANENRTHVIHS